MVGYSETFSTGGSMLFQIFVGYIVIKYGFLPKEFIGLINGFVFRVNFVPLMARAFWNRNFGSLDFKPMLVTSCASISTQLALCILFLLPLEDPFFTYLSMVLPIIYLNYLIIGVPIFNSIWGEANNQITAVVIISNDLIIVPMYQILTTIYKIRQRNKENLENGKEIEKFSLSIIYEIAKNVISSPIIIGIIIGMTWSFIGLPNPIIIDQFMSVISQSTMGLALFCVGGFLSQHSFIACKWSIFLSSLFFRFIVMPSFSGLFGYLFGLSNLETRQCMIMTSFNTATICYSMSQTAGFGPDVSTTMVFWTVVLVVPMVTLWLWVLDQFKLFVV